MCRYSGAGVVVVVVVVVVLDVPYPHGCVATGDVDKRVESCSVKPNKSCVV